MFIYVLVDDYERIVDSRNPTREKGPRMAQENLLTLTLSSTRVRMHTLSLSLSLS